MTTLHLDKESRSFVELPNVGVYVYAEHPSTETLLMSYALDDAAPVTWFPRTSTHAGQPIPADLVEALRDPR